MGLLARLVSIQQALGLSDRKFADKLGVSDALWVNTRNGKRAIRYEVLSGAVAAFPDNERLKEDVLAFLMESGLADAQRDTASATA